VTSADIQDVHIRMIDYKNLLKVDRVLVLLTLVLAVIGVMTLLSADQSSEYAGSFALKQVRNIIIASLFAVAIVVCDYRWLVAAAPLFFVVTIGLLIAVEVIGAIRNNAQSWIDLGFMNIQPSELTKVAIIYMYAWYAQKLKDRIRRFHWFAIAFAIPAIPGILIILQPDFGTAMTLGPLVFVLLFMAGCRKWQLGVVVLLGMIAATVLILHAKDVINPPEGMTGLKPNQKARIESFLNPDADPLNEGWHQLQTRIAIGSGGMWGRGYMQGVQTHHAWVPEHHTDSIFVLFAEEHGFVGGTVLIGLFTVFLLRGLQLSRQARDLEGSLLAIGSVTILATHVFINIGITLGVMPVTGLPLPFLSYAGSFYITVMMCVGTILSVSIRRKPGMFSEREPVVRAVARA